MQHLGTQLKGWINSFLKQRGRATPNGQPLYTYATTDAELELLGAALAVSPEERHNPVSGVYWAAGYCLFVSEKYRREYDANWSWQAFDLELGIRLNPDEHKELVRKGLGYWKRPVRERACGADYLGSLFAEGGLPWKLLQSEKHGFGRAIKAGLRHYHDCKRDGRDLTQVIREFAQYFPQSFQTDEKYQLLARVAETLMLLAETHNLGQRDDPAAYLNIHYPQWRQEFPLPLGEANGYRLVNEWLRDAGVRLEERRRAEEAARHFTCEHRLDGPPEQARLLAEVRLPRLLKVKLGDRRISTTRVELALYEGERMARNLGIAYGRLDNDELAVRLPAQVVTCPRESPEKSLVLECSCAGERLDIRNIQSSEVDWNHLPAVFVETEDEIRLTGVASVNTRDAEVLLRVPAGMVIQEARPVTTDVDNGTWYRVNDTTVIEDRGSRYVIVPGNTASAASPDFS